MIPNSQLSRLGLFDAKVPRYTSYPTAPHFKPDVGPDTFSRWIADIEPGSLISLYIHVPFCRRLCWFCACRTQGTRTDAPIVRYIETLKAELKLLKELLPPGIRLSRLHWGGGTPTLLTPALMTDLAQSIFDFAPLDGTAEFSVEIDPNEIDSDRLDALTAAGMNRASIGVQDFNRNIQAKIGRHQSFDRTRDVVDMIRARGITSLNADILFGLPHQTRGRITESVQKLLSLTPDRVALYGYAHVPWMAKRQQLIPSDALPTPEQRLDLFQTARDLFLWDGFTEIGIDHFATRSDGLSRARNAGRLRRNFQGYTDDQADVLIGVGASSISRFPQGYAQNALSTSAYTGAIQQGGFAVAKGHVFVADDRLRARLIEALMCDFEINLTEIMDCFGIKRSELVSILAPVDQAFENTLCLTNDRLIIPPEARTLTRMIARHLDAYDLCKAGHSTAI
ncbi:MAG: oxygen-independent coproporphyrinogen III oxidase [Pseudomonadota bacterium]